MALGHFDGRMAELARDHRQGRRSAANAGKRVAQQVKVAAGVPALAHFHHRGARMPPIAAVGAHEQPRSLPGLGHRLLEEPRGVVAQHDMAPPLPGMDREVPPALVTSLGASGATR